MSLINDDYLTKINKRGIGENNNENNKKFKGIASTPTNSEDYEYAQLSNEISNTLEEKQKVDTTETTVLRNLVEMKEDEEEDAALMELIECVEIDTGTASTNYYSVNSQVHFKSLSAGTDGQIEVGDNGAEHPVNSDDASQSNWDRYSRKYVDNNPYACDFCHETFACSEHLLKHYSTHTDEKLFKCNVCDKRCLNKSALIAHGLMHTAEKPYFCVACNKSFKLKKTRDVHYKTHTDEKPFKCDVCSQSFKRKCSLTVHYRLHTAQTPFICDICGNTFTQRGSLNVHYRLHTGEKPYGCGLCEQSFHTNSKLTQHEKTVHK